jgi:hypothetical protein
MAALLQGAALHFASIAQGHDSRITSSREAVVRSARQWQTLWTEHSGSPAPDVALSESLVVAVFLGSRPTAGYAVEIVRVRRETDATVVEYRERTPPPGALVAQMLTSPFHVVSIPRDTSPVRFLKLPVAP